MEVRIDYRRELVKAVCENCRYFADCGMEPKYDCEALKKLVKICENVDLYNPTN